MAARVSRDREFSPLGMEYATLFPCTRDIIRVIERVCIRFVTHVAVLKFAHWAIYLRDNRAGSRFVPSWKWAICPPGQFSVQFVTVFELISVVTEARRACWRRFWKYVIGQRCYLYLCCGVLLILRRGLKGYLYLSVEIWWKECFLILRDYVDVKTVVSKIIRREFKMTYFWYLIFFLYSKIIKWNIYICISRKLFTMCVQVLSTK